jgi:hypothetical protein
MIFTITGLRRVAPEAEAVNCPAAVQQKLKAIEAMERYVQLLHDWTALNKCIKESVCSMPGKVYEIMH